MHDELQLARPSIQIQTPSLRDLAAVFFRHKRLFVISFIAVVTLGVLYAARLVLKGGEWSSARLPNKTIVVSRALEAYYHSRYEKPVVYLPNGTELRQPLHGRELLRLGLTAGQYVLFLGRFSPEKNCDMLIDAFEQVDTSMKLVLAGGSSHTDEYVAKLRAHESDKIRLLDWLSGDALAEVLTNAALFVLPSDMEGLSLALLDAMGAGVCVLASDTPENREVIANAGFMFRREEVEHLRQMITMLIADADLRAAIGRAGKRRVQQEYLWDGVTEQLEQMYRELTGSKRVRASEPVGSATSGKAA